MEEIKTKKMNRKIFLLFGFILLVACSPKLKYEEKIDFAPEGWHKDSLAIFDVSIVDTSNVLTIGLTLQHGKKYAYSNVWLFISVEDEAGVAVRDTLEFFVARPNGKWLGKNKDGGYEVSAIYKKGVRMKHIGDYRFSIAHGMRDELLKNIDSFEFWVQ